jgi:hypothetical protein
VAVPPTILLSGRTWVGAPSYVGQLHNELKINKNVINIYTFAIPSAQANREVIKTSLILLISELESLK